MAKKTTKTTAAAGVPVPAPTGSGAATTPLHVPPGPTRPTGIGKLKIDLANCYGIKKLRHEFDFSDGRAYAIYAGTVYSKPRPTAALFADEQW